MITHEANKQTTVFKSEGLTSTAYTIKATPAMFMLLAKNMYKRPHEAVVRELACNALDAHIMVGKAHEPFEVHYPTSLEPWFSVRDFGPGLSPDNIIALYTTFGGTSKDNSNEVIGGLGIGSKSPFSVTDLFTVTSIHNGMKAVYVCDKNGGSPTVTCLSPEAPTSERNGIEVRIDSGSYDFSNKHETVFRFFDVQPRLTGYKVVGDKLVFTNNVAVARNTYDDDLFVVMGPVTYPVDQHALTPEAHEACKLITEYLYENSSTYIKIPIGSVTIQPSREELVWDKATVNFISKTIISIVAELLKDWHVKFDAAKTYGDAYRVVRDFYLSIKGLSYKVDEHYDNNVTKAFIKGCGFDFIKKFGKLPDKFPDDLGYATTNMLAIEVENNYFYKNGNRTNVVKCTNHTSRWKDVPQRDTSGNILVGVPATKVLDTSEHWGYFPEPLKCLENFIVDDMGVISSWISNNTKADLSPLYSKLKWLSAEINKPRGSARDIRYKVFASEGDLIQFLTEFCLFSVDIQNPSLADFVSKYPVELSHIKHTSTLGDFVPDSNVIDKDKKTTGPKQRVRKENLSQYIHVVSKDSSYNSYNGPLTFSNVSNPEVDPVTKSFDLKDFIGIQPKGEVPLVVVDGNWNDVSAGRKKMFVDNARLLHVTFLFLQANAYNSYTKQKLNETKGVVTICERVNTLSQSEIVKKIAEESLVSSKVILDEVMNYIYTAKTIAEASWLVTLNNQGLLPKMEDPTFASVKSILQLLHTVGYAAPKGLMLDRVRSFYNVLDTDTTDVLYTEFLANHKVEHEALLKLISDYRRIEKVIDTYRGTPETVVDIFNSWYNTKVKGVI